ncbi:MAG TPA: hypothetical protein VN902_03115 [Candidatus Acidoferrales bacterium]|nr:hypothetical protein [Candidatus Acidoferrales bacterium]
MAIRFAVVVGLLVLGAELAAITRIKPENTTAIIALACVPAFGLPLVEAIAARKRTRLHETESAVADLGLSKRTMSSRPPRDLRELLKTIIPTESDDDLKERVKLSARSGAIDSALREIEDLATIGQDTEREDAWIRQYIARRVLGSDESRTWLKRRINDIAETLNMSKPNVAMIYIDLLWEFGSLFQSEREETFKIVRLEEPKSQGSPLKRIEILRMD